MQKKSSGRISFGTSIVLYRGSLILWMFYIPPFFYENHLLVPKSHFKRINTWPIKVLTINFYSTYHMTGHFFYWATTQVYICSGTPITDAHAAEVLPHTAKLLMALHQPHYCWIFLTFTKLQHCCVCSASSTKNTNTQFPNKNYSHKTVCSV